MTTEALTREEMTEFTSSNREAMLYMTAGAQDYAAARCCLINGLFTGLILGAQALEKHMKAMLMFRNPSIPPKSFSHSLSKLADKVTSDGIADLKPYVEVIAKFNAHYQSRYPDNPGRSTSASTAELKQLDEVMDILVAAMPIPRDIALRSGVYTRAIQSTETGMRWPEGIWLTQNHPFLLERLPALVRDSKTVI